MSSTFAFASAPSPEELAGFDLNDYGNAMRLIRLSGGTIDDDGEVDVTRARLLFQLGAGWVAFNGRFWDRKLGDELARRTAHKVARTMRGLFAELTARAVPAKTIMSYLDACGNSGGTTAMLKQAQSYLTVEIDAFDRDPWVLNCPNGTLQLRDRAGGFAPTLRPHDPADRITRMTAVAFDPEAAAPLFRQVETEALEDDAERAYFRRWLGYASTGCVHEQAFALAQGRGRDGKSTLLDACREALGSYGAVGNVTTFLEGVRSSEGPDPELVKLAGDVRLVVLSEPPRGSKLNEGRLKAWTSGAPISARDLHAKPFDFRPVGKLTWECNAFPVARGDDDGIWRRIKTMLFRHQVPEERMDRSLPGRIRAGELSGVLNWLVAGVGDWMAEGLAPPDSMRQVLEDYRKASSPFGDWLAERCVLGEAGSRTLSSALYADYKAWFEYQGFEKPMSARAFGDALRDRQVLLAGRAADGKKYRGPIRLKRADERDAEIAGDPPPGPLAAPASPSGAGCPSDPGFAEDFAAHDFGAENEQ